MATDRTHSNSTQALTRSGMVMFALIAGVALIGMAGLIGMEGLQEFPTTFGIALASALFWVGVWKRQSWCLFGALLTVFVYRFGDISQDFGLRNALTGGDVIFTIATLVFMASCFRFLECSKICQAFHAVSNSKTDGARSWRLDIDSVFRGRWWMLLFSGVAAWRFLEIIGLDREASRKWWMTPPATRLAMMAFFLFFFWFVCRGLIALRTRWKMSPEQGSIYFRSVFAREFWREHSSVERRRVKILRRDRTRRDLQGER